MTATLKAVSYTVEQPSTATSATVSWATGDYVVVFGGNEGATNGIVLTISTTGSGLSFGTPLRSQSSSSDCTGYCWAAKATASSSGTISVSSGNSSQHSDIYVLIVDGTTSAGIGNTAISTGSSLTASLTSAQADSLIAWAVWDWSAGAVGTSPSYYLAPTPSAHSSSSPGPSAIAYAVKDSTRYSLYYGDKDDQPSTAAVGYGVTSSAGSGPFTIIAVEVKASATGTTASAGNAAVSVTANNPSTALTTTAGDGAVTVAALSPTPSASIAAGLGSVTVAAYQPTPSLSFTAGSGNVTVASYAPTISTGGNVTVTAGVGAVTVTSYTPVTVLAVTAGDSAVTVAADDPTPSVAFTAGNSSVSVSGLGPSASVAFTAGHASVTAASYNPVSEITFTAGHANTTIAAHGATPLATVFPGDANVTVAAYDPTVAGGAIAVTAGLASVVMAAFDVTITLPARLIAFNAIVGAYRWDVDLNMQRWDARVVAARWSAQTSQPRWEAEVTRFA